MNRIRNYEDLMVERRKVENIIVEEKQAIKERIDDIRQKLEPVFYVLNIFKKKESNNGLSAKGTPNNSLLKVGTSLIIDLLVGQKLLGKANWLMRLLVPLVLKTVSSKVIDTTENGRAPQLEKTGG